MDTARITWYELPDRYHKDMLRLMVRDAHTLHVYWEISNRRRWLCSQHFECDWSELPKVLRVYDVTAIYFHGHNANRFFDIQATPEATSWYIGPVQANSTYMVDYGVRTPEGQFVPLLRSNAVMTPRDGEAPWGEPLQPTVPEVRGPEPVTGRIMPHFFENFGAYSNCMK
ncbi:DUF4912 domain-containing protein [Paenibacillus sp. GD4]|uniref:DUF4912 domain-containing protein n=1 Tax=Paenibacillus sp. GD4 TaxID=3068890 RepID=UPI002796CE5A|nr:DUF4912 domain-containing protein [Paenibacillus sp. GD4]MDQ1911712.1 DUF4912 domain-containing protein [Paenibacillus sp. GD4]